MKIGKIEKEYNLDNYIARGPGRSRQFTVFYDMKPGDSVQVRLWPFADHKDFMRKYRVLASNLSKIGLRYGGKFSMRTIDSSVGKIRVWKVS